MGASRRVNQVYRRNTLRLRVPGRRAEAAERDRARGWVNYHLLGPLRPSDLEYIASVSARHGPRSVLVSWYGRLGADVAYREYLRLVR